MQPVINISRGNILFTSRPLTNEVLLHIVQAFLEKIGLTASIKLTEKDSPNFLTINDNVCQFPATLPAEVEACLPATVNNDKTFWNHFIMQLLWIQPQVFNTASLAEELFPSFNGASQDAAGIAEALLESKICLTDKNSLSKFAAEYTDRPLLTEDLIAAYSSAQINICVNPAYFESIIKLPGSGNLFQLLREGLFYETGIIYPPFKFLFKEELAQKSFYFEINGYSCLPFKGIDTGTLLVNDIPERLSAMGIEATATINPANGYAASFINADSKAAVENAGFTTWNSMGYFILCMSRFLGINGYLCITKKTVQQQLDKLKTYYPELGASIETEQLPVITQTLRLLARERLSIRNLKLILEAVADCDWIRANDNDHIIFDERIPLQTVPPAEWKSDAVLLTSFVRTRLKKYISHLYTKGAATLVVYLLDPAIERLFTALGNLTEEDELSVLKATCDEFANLPVTGEPPVVLTTQTVRPHFKKCIEKTYPQVVVLAYTELSPDMNIQPIARISLV